jgi:heme-degrading monooxygenase HmoA
MSQLVKTPEPPYYAVIFTSRLRQDNEGYGETAERMDQLAREMPGYLGIESARNDDGLGITVSYWASEADIVRWKSQLEHREAQSRGRKQWYEQYEVRVAKVERAYSFSTVRFTTRNP